MADSALQKRYQQLEKLKQAKQQQSAPKLQGLAAYAELIKPKAPSSVPTPAPAAAPVPAQPPSASSAHAPKKRRQAIPKRELSTDQKEQISAAAVAAVAVPVPPETTAVVAAEPSEGHAKSRPKARTKRKVPGEAAPVVPVPPSAAAGAPRPRKRIPRSRRTAVFVSSFAQGDAPLIAEIFSDFGPATSVNFPDDAIFGTITYQDPESAQLALSLDYALVSGSRIHVEWARLPPALQKRVQSSAADDVDADAAQDSDSDAPAAVETSSAQPAVDVDEDGFAVPVLRGISSRAVSYSDL